MPADLQPVPKGDVVPGVMRCDGCKFELTRMNLNVNVGTVTAGDLAPEPCPNGCGPLRPTTWRERANDAMDAAETMLDRAVAAEKDRDQLRALWLEWELGEYDGADLLRRVRLALHGAGPRRKGSVGVPVTKTTGETNG